MSVCRRPVTNVIAGWILHVTFARDILDEARNKQTNKHRGSERGTEREIRKERVDRTKERS